MKNDDEKDYDGLSLAVQIFLASFSAPCVLCLVLALTVKREQEELFDMLNKTIFGIGLFVSIAGLIPLTRGIFKLSKFALALVCELLSKKR